MANLLFERQSSSSPTAKQVNSDKRFTKHSPPTPITSNPVASAEKSVSLHGFNFSYKFLTCPSPQASPIFFISGAFQSMKSWKSLGQYFLSRGVPIILADLPGTGDADPLPAEYGLNFLSDAILIVLDDLMIDKVSIISASYGTPIAYSFAAQYPDRVVKLILAGTMKEVPCHMKQRVADTLTPLREGRMEQFAKEVAEGLVVMDSSIPVHRRNLAYRLLCTQLASMNQVDKNKYILNTRRILSHKPLDLDFPPKCPTLVFTGEHDAFTTPTYCLEIANSISNSFFTTINESDHMFHVEHPSVVNNVCYEFMLNGDISSLDGIGPVQPSGFLNSSSLQELPVAA